MLYNFVQNSRHIFVVIYRIMANITEDLYPLTCSTFPVSFFYFKKYFVCVRPLVSITPENGHYLK